jgi:NTP pyrophosphatase (non-canonical NTP hydrolase)
MNFLSKLRDINVRRCEQCFFPLHYWNVLEWSGAMAGEAGEVANAAKKIHRDGYSDKKLKNLADEIADTIIYLDLLAASEGIDLEEAIRHKFNTDSKKQRCIDADFKEEL